MSSCLQKRQGIMSTYLWFSVVPCPLVLRLSCCAVVLRDDWLRMPSLHLYPHYIGTAFHSMTITYGGGRGRDCNTGGRGANQVE